MSPLPRALKRAMVDAPREPRGELLRWYWGLGLNRRTVLARQVARLTARLGAAAAAKVCRLAADLDPAHHETWIRVAMELGARPILELLDREAFAAAAPDFPALAWYLGARSRGFPRAWMLHGLALRKEQGMALFRVPRKRAHRRAMELGPAGDRPFAPPRPCPPAPLDPGLLAGLRQHFEPDAWAYQLALVFGAVSAVPEALGPLARLAPAVGDRNDALALVRLLDQTRTPADVASLATLADAVQGRPRPEASALLEMAAEILPGLEPLPDRQDRFRLVLELALARNRAGAAGRPRFDLVLLLERLPLADLPRLLAAPASTLMALDRALFDSDQAPAVEAGLVLLARELPVTFAQGLELAPKAWLKAARALGRLRPGRAPRVLAAYRADPLASLDPTRLEGLAPMAGTLASSPVNPMSRRLREHLGGATRLSAPSLARHLAELARGLPAARLELIARLALADAAGRVPVPVPADPAGEHAVWMAEQVRENRGALRRLLAAGPGARDAHPASLRWLARAGAPDPDLWLRGLTRTVEVEGLGRLTLGIESDPREILRMGTHVQSCVGLGGCNAFGAAAVALDVNKQVVYARDGAGRVRARQLLALDEDDGLVCFYVYPAGVGRAMEQAFKDYDLAFAEALGVPVRIDELSSRTSWPIERLVAEHWYDDGAWSLVVAD